MRGRLGTWVALGLCERTEVLSAQNFARLRRALISFAPQIACLNFLFRLRNPSAFRLRISKRRFLRIHILLSHLKKNAVSVY